jgi:hypothetical protein
LTASKDLAVPNALADGARQRDPDVAVLGEALSDVALRD